MSYYFLVFHDQAAHTLVLKTHHSMFVLADGAYTWLRRRKSPLWLRKISRVKIQPQGGCRYTNSKNQDKRSDIEAEHKQGNGKER
jgi:hypothetical protein